MVNTVIRFSVAVVTYAFAVMVIFCSVDCDVYTLEEFIAVLVGVGTLLCIGEVIIGLLAFKEIDNFYCENEESF